VDVLSYNINLDLVHLSTHRLAGFTTIELTPKQNATSQIKLYLLKLSVDSVYYQNAKITTFTYNDTILQTNLPAAININDTALLKVFYHGIPQVDGSGWGGFYFSSDSNYAYNLGVGFQAEPHSYGRVWFPCIDEFPERAFYETNITVKNGNKAICGGTLMSVTDNGNNTSTFHWKLHAAIPSYLASVAVANYVAVTDTFAGMNGNVPIQIYVPAVDTSLVKASFINLKSILGIFESKFGPYLWERVGYVGVPFNSGAMESATNIDYPLFAIDGTTNYESLYGHELSHHWFGDLATCATEFDMWFNEGMASYCEPIYMEGLYGAEVYKNTVRSNHLKVIQTCHIVDNGYRAVYGIPSEYTYSTTVYDKGADMAHTLRYYMGDSLFFSSFKAMLNTYKFKDISTIQMRDFLSSNSGIDLTDFFNAWIFSPGFPHFSIDSMKVNSVTPQVKTRIWVRQRLNYAPAFANSNHLEVTFGNNNWQFFTDTLHFSGQLGTKEFTLPFVPDFVMMDYNEKISDATTDMYKVIKTTGGQVFTASLCNLDVISVPDSALVRVEHNWVAPDPLKTANPDIKRLSDYHYWKVDGILPNSFIAKGKFKYNRIVSSSTGNLDNILLPYVSSTDSILLLYRKNAAEDWKIIDFSRFGNTSTGYLVVDTLRKGEYTLAVGTPYWAYINKNEKPGGDLNVFPNPSNNSFTFSFSVTNKAEIKIYNSLGVEIDSMKIGPEMKTAIWNANDNSSGAYYARLMTENKKLITEKKLLLVK
jgi:aminopeptidase N